jgi:SRSO17 transposase
MRRFDDLFTRVTQRRGFREYLAGLAPRDRNKTLTGLAGAEPVTGAQHPAVQRLQFFLSESRWDPGAVNARRLDLLRAGPPTAPHGGGVLVIDDSGDRKGGVKTAHMGRQWLGRYGKTKLERGRARRSLEVPYVRNAYEDHGQAREANGVAAVSTLGRRGGQGQ